MENYYGYSPAYLEHHGVKGMKWGVRKKQIKSGVRGAKKYAKGYTQDYKTHLKTTYSMKGKDAKTTNSLSDRALKRKVERRDLEDRFGKEVKKSNSHNSFKKRLDNQREYYRRASIPTKVLKKRVNRLELENRLNSHNQRDRERRQMVVDNAANFVDLGAKIVLGAPASSVVKKRY